jgi:tRNA C32,U32 (ribose-2'-O)-methylase TrmJ
MLDEVRRQIEQLDLIACFGINANAAAAETIFDRRGRGVYSWQHSGHRATGLPFGRERPGLW